MKRLLINCIICLNKKINKYNIIIKDIDDNILLNRCVNNLDNISFDFKNNTIYKIYIMSQLFIVYINDNIKDKLVFYVGNSIRRCNTFIPITIKITDSYYKDLPIMEGNIYVKRNIDSYY